MAGSSHLDSSARVVTWSGFAIVALFVTSLFVAPSTEFVREGITATQLAELYREHRSLVLTGIYIGSLTWGAVFLVFCAALSRTLALSSEETGLHASIGLIGGTVESVAILGYCLLTSMAAYDAGGVGPTDVLLLHHGALLANNLSGFPTIVCVAAYTLGGRREGIFPSWLVGLAALCVVMHWLSTASLAPAGVAAPSGPASLLAPFTMTAWVLGVSIVMRKRVGSRRNSS